jgi:hypothetical protein
MTLTRIIVLVVGVLAVMLAVVILRAETTRIHYQVSNLERRDDVLRQQLLRERLALQRARSPVALLNRVEEARLSEPDGDAPSVSARTIEP